MAVISHKTPVGINGIGRIGKLLLWIISARKHQTEIAVSTGRNVGKNLDDFATYLAYDSTYGTYEQFMFGFGSGKRVEIKEECVYLNGMRVRWLNDPRYRNSGNIPWSDYGVEIVFDTTGKAVDPVSQEDNSLRGHLKSARKVILTAPFKIKNKGSVMPSDAVTLVGGVNFDKYDSSRHNVISNASCTTNCCAPVIKALVDHFGENLVSYALTTVHAATNSQSVLDTLPKDGDKDTRKRRSTIGNIIPTSTGAANAVLEVIPEIRDLGIGSQASSLRVPTATGSIVILDVSIIGEYDNEYMHEIFRRYAEKNPEVILFSERQLVSSDIVGSPYSTIYDAPFTHHRTSKRNGQAYTMFDLNFWYDNEFGYVNTLMRLFDLITGIK